MKKTRMPIISAIVAVAENGVIGGNNQLLWHLPADLRHFKTITTGHPIIMGRKTYLSIGRPLPNRTNIIMTRDPGFIAPGCVVVTSLEAAIAHAASEQANEVFIIGGADIYAQCLTHLERLYLTEVHAAFNGDVFFPALDLTNWQETSREAHKKDELNPYDYTFVVLERSDRLR